MSTPTERDQDRAAHPDPCTTTNGHRDYTPPPNPDNIVRNFGWTKEQQ